MYIKLFFITILFLLGVYICSTYKSRDILQGFETSCPDMLVQKGSELWLYNSKLKETNPIRFKNLEEYMEFIEWQRSKDIRCPVLFLQEAYDTQGEQVYKVRDSPSNPSGGNNTDPTLLQDATRDDPPYNQNTHPGFDAHNQMVGEDNVLDKYYDVGRTQPVSANPMDDNWGGVKYSRAAVDAGNYKGNEVSIQV